MENKKLMPLLVAALFFSGCVSDGGLDNGNSLNQSGIPSTTTHIKVDVSSTSSTSSSSTTKEDLVVTTTAFVTVSTSFMTASSSTTTIPVDNTIRVEVVMFYPGTQCSNCIKVGELAEETVNTYYFKELSEGKISYRKINFLDSKNKEISAKYGPETASLWIGTYVNGTFYKEMKLGVWYRTGDPEDYMAYLKGYIDKRLEGDLT